MRCGYPASSIRERIYADLDGGRGTGILLYTGSPDAEGTLGGLVQQARHIEDTSCTRSGWRALCSNDPICAQHDPGEAHEERWLHGAACHGCALSPRRRARCATTTSIARWSCRCSASPTRRSSGAST